MPTAPESVLPVASAGGPPASPLAILATPSAGGAPVSPLAILATPGSAGAAVAPVAILATPGAGGAPVSPLSILATPGAGGDPAAPEAVLGTVTASSGPPTVIVSGFFGESREFANGVYLPEADGDATMWVRCQQGNERRAIFQFNPDWGYYMYLIQYADGYAGWADDPNVFYVPSGSGLPWEVEWYPDAVVNDAMTVTQGPPDGGGGVAAPAAVLSPGGGAIAPAAPAPVLP